MPSESDSAEIDLYDHTGDFAEDKDIAARIRDQDIRPVVAGGGNMTIGFSGISLATQSFAHALISDILRSHGEEVLDRIEFKDCNPGVRGIIETVVQYSLETSDDDSDQC